MVEILSIIAAVAMVVGTGALVLLHVLPTGYNPIRDAVSDYAIGRYRAGFWVFTTAGALSGLALAIALARSHPPKPTLTVAMLLLSAAARFLIPLFPTDQDGNRFQTAKGTIHMILASPSSHRSPWRPRAWAEPLDTNRDERGRAVAPARDGAGSLSARAAALEAAGGGGRSTGLLRRGHLL